MKIFNALQILTWHAYTILYEPVSSINLMERACRACVEWMRRYYTHDKVIKVFCGTGNNGGDGLAIARMLLTDGYKVQVYCIHTGAQKSGDFLINEKRLAAIPEKIIQEMHEDKSLPDISENDIIIDALFGTGLSRPVEGFAAIVIRHINAANATVISIDMPSGLFCDQCSVAQDAVIIKANHTLSFERYKLAFLFAENHEYIGSLSILPIGLQPQFLVQEPAAFYLLEKKDIQSLIKIRDPFSHKGKFGHALLLAGSKGKMGAAVLAAKACLRAGAGLLSVHVPACGQDILQISIPEAMVDLDEEENSITAIPNMSGFNAVGVGPGIGKSPKTQTAVKQLLKQSTSPLVLDADALNILSEHKDWLDLLPQNSILTPHPKEFERLAGISTNAFDRNKRQVEFSKKHHVFVVLKGRFTCISSPDGNCYFNPTGNPGMAKGGSGDTLTGILLSLLAQQYTPLQACMLGVYLHGLAGDIAVQKTGQAALLASDLIDHIGTGYDQLQAE